MTKIAQSKFKQHRRLKINVSGSPKSSYEKRNYPPGQHGRNGIVNIKDYKKQLEAKQLLKWYYGGSRLRESQFRSLFKEAEKMRGDTGELFVGLLERRLDAAVYNLGLAPTIFAARQLVSHKNIAVNGKIVNISSYRLKVGDKIEPSAKAKQFAITIDSVEKKAESIPSYWSFEKKDMAGTLLKVPSLQEIPYPFELNINLIIEYYSK